MPTTSKIIADSISESGVRLTTMVLEYPRIIHSEFMTHRMFSRNASSSRAIPVSNNIKRVQTDGFIPSYLGKNQKGMQAFSELEEWEKNRALEAWEEARKNAVLSASLLNDYGVHKQLANRLLEPFSHIQVVVSATEWSNFFAQRLHPAAQPEIQELARVMKEAMDNSVPKLLQAGEWHLPFVTETDEEIDKAASDFYYNKGILVDRDFLDVRKKVSVARCARVSYSMNSVEKLRTIEDDLTLYNYLYESKHLSPFEHIATPMQFSSAYDYGDMLDWTDVNGITHMDKNMNLWSANLKGWIMYRQTLD